MINLTGPQCRQTPAGLLFDPFGGTPAYLSRKDHQRQATGPRNKWSIPPTDEYQIFSVSYGEKWTCAKGHNWGLREHLDVIGTNEQRIAKFPQPSNVSDERHGYPVSALDKHHEFDHRPPPLLTAQWRQSGLISEAQKARIDRGKV